MKRELCGVVIAAMLLGPGCGIFMSESFDNELSMPLRSDGVLFVADSIQIVATAKYDVERSDPVYKYRSDKFPERYEWTSSNPSVATVDSLGMVRGVAVGMTNISTTFQAVTKTATLRVTPRVVSLMLAPRNATRTSEDTVSFQVTPLDGQQQPTGPVAIELGEEGGVARLDSGADAPATVHYRVFTPGTAYIFVRVPNVRDDRIVTSMFSVTIAPKP